MSQFPSCSSSPSSPRGFTLVELLVVLAIISCLTCISTLAFHNIAASQNLGKGVRDTAYLLELARTEAVTRQTYVWVGFQPVSDTNRSDLVVGAVYSKDGTGTNTDASNLAPLTKPLQLSNVKLVDRTNLKSATQDLLPVQTLSISSNDTGAKFDLAQIQFESTTVTFTPSGEVLLKGNVGPNDGYDQLIDLSLRQTKGNTVRLEADDLSLLVDGSNGSVKIVRVQ